MRCPSIRPARTQQSQLRLRLPLHLVVLLDPPPALGTISLAVMQAANALLVPLAATTPDFCSTVQFLSMMDPVLQQLSHAGIEVEYSFLRLICSKFDGNDPSHAMVRTIMEQSFGPALLPVPILESAEIDLIWLSEAQMRRIEPYFCYRTGCLGSMIGGSSAGSSS